MGKAKIKEAVKIKGGETMKPILIVEDETVMRESLRDWLTDAGYQVETAEEGEEALKTVTEQDFGIAILDLRLPGKDGLEVLREAREKNPQLKGIIITAYPSVQTAVEAIKEGAIDYLSKPFDLNELEKLIRDTLGPVQVEIKPKAATREAVAEPAAVEEVKAEELIAIAPEEIPDHLKKGTADFETGNYQEALKEFKSVLKVAPGNIEARVWVRKATKAILEPESVETEAGTKPKQCVWMKMGMVDYRICTNEYDCLSCEFDQSMQEKMASGESTELDAALERFKELPGSQRLCRYALKGDVSYRLCSRAFQCETCEFSQMMDEALQKKLTKLAARREALRKQEAA
jgi:CheY-like chemotaxis protein